MKELKITSARLHLIARQYYAINELFINSKGIVYPLITQRNQEFELVFTRNEDMWAIVDLLREMKLWYQEDVTWKYAREGI